MTFLLKRKTRYSFFGRSENFQFFSVFLFNELAKNVFWIKIRRDAESEPVPGEDKGRPL